MLVDIIMPKLGESIVEGTVLVWRKAVGDKVAKDEVLLEVSTDKVDSEIPSLEAGTLAQVLVQAGTRVDVGAVLGRLEVSAGAGAAAGAGTVTAAMTGAGAGTGEKTSTDAGHATHITDAADSSYPGDSADSVDSGSSSGSKEDQDQSDRTRFWSPLVLRMAAEAGVSNAELSQLAGTGSGGRVTKSDLQAFLERRKAGKTAVKQADASGAAAPKATASAGSATSVQTLNPPMGGAGEFVPLDTIQRKMAAHMRESLDTSAHAWSMFEVDLTQAQLAIERRREETLAATGVKLTLNHYILQAVVHALEAFPLMNGRLEQDGWRKQSRIGLGVAVASPKGLLVPVVRDAQDLSFQALARVSNDLAQRARSGKLLPDELFGSTFTVTNYGVFGQDAGLPIINQPNVGILGVGAAKKRPVVVETPHGAAIGIATTAWLTLGFDHRLVDGQTAAGFLKAIKDELEGIA